MAEIMEMEVAAIDGNYMKTETMQVSELRATSENIFVLR
jgi:hypothetical protein